MSKLRFRVVETAFKKKAATVETPAERPSEYFAKYVFNREKMFKYLPGAVYAKLDHDILRPHGRLSPQSPLCPSLQLLFHAGSPYLQFCEKAPSPALEVRR